LLNGKRVVLLQLGGKDIKVHNNATVDEIDYITVLQSEIGILKSRIEDHDTGHLYTTISVLEQRIDEEKDKLRAKIHA